MTFEQVREHLQYSYDLGSRFVDFEGGEVTIWKDGDKRINDLIVLANEIGFFSCTITTNAQLPFKGYPIMNSKSGLKLMKTNKFARRCWVTDFICPDDSRGLCIGDGTSTCDKCGFCMAGEMASVFAFRPDTIFAGLKLRG